MGMLHIMVQAHASTGHCDTTMFDDFRVWRVGAEKELTTSTVAEPLKEISESEAAITKPEVSEYAKWAMDQEEGASASATGQGEGHLDSSVLSTDSDPDDTESLE